MPATLSFDGKGVDIDAISAAVNAEIGEQPAEQATPTPSPAPTQPAEVVASPAPAAQAEQATPLPAPIEELRTVKITVDGQEIEVTEADLKAGHMRHRDLTYSVGLAA